MYKVFLILILPFILYAKSGVLLSVADGDTVVFKNGNTLDICNIAYIDTPEIKENKKLNLEMSQCNFPKADFLKAGKYSSDYAKTLFKVGKTYEYEVVREAKNKTHFCSVKLPKGLHIELNPSFDELMVSKGFALPYVIYASKEKKELFLKVAKDAKTRKIGLWKEYPDLMQCLIKHRYSLRSLN